MQQENYSQRLRLFQITEDDRKSLRELKGIIEPQMNKIVDAFYDHVGQFPEAVEIIKKANSNIAQLKTTNPGYFAHIFQGDLGAEYFAARHKVGVIHAKINLEPTWFFGAMSTYYNMIFPLVMQKHRFNINKGTSMLVALQKVFNLDQALIMEAYINNSVLELKSVTDETSAVIERLRETSANLSAAGSESNEATTRVASVVEELSAATLSQAESTSSASDEMRSVADASMAMSAGAQNQLQSIRKAQDSVREAQAMIEEIDRQAGVWKELRKRMQVLEKMKESVKDTGDRVDEMNDRSNEIGRIVQTIDGIAEQTNLLALNAAIEAARAGEHGRGFAVVAEQVRKLAENSSSATREISDLIQKVQAGAQGCASSMGEALGGVDEVSALTVEAAQCLEQISEAAVNATKLNKVVGSAMTDVEGIAQQNCNEAEAIGARISSADQAMQNIAAITEENSSASHEVSAAAHEMRAQVEELLSSVRHIDSEIESLTFIAHRARVAAEQLGKAA